MESSSLKPWPYQIGVGTCDLSPRAKAYVNKSLDTNRLSYGPFSQAFEKRIAEDHGCRFAVFVNSGTSALRIAVAALKEVGGWHDGDEIIIPAVTFVSDVNVIVHNRLTPVFVDVHPETYNINPDRIKEKITDRTRAIMPTHLCGLAAEMDPIVAIAKEHDLKIIEDACEAAYARYKGKPVGSFGDISCFSTYQAHIVATGVGGFAITNNPDLAVLLRSLANHGRDGIYMHIDDDKGKTAEELKQIVTRRFSFIRPGYSFRATEMEAAIGLAQLEDGIHQEIEKRQANAKRLTETLSVHKELQLPTYLSLSDHAFMMFPIVLKKECGVDRDDFIHFLELHNIETRMILPLINQPFVIQAFGDLSSQCPEADHINKNGFYIGCHPSMTSEEIAYIGEAFAAYLDSPR